MKKIALLGASGSIGKNTLEIIRRNKDKYQLVAFSVYSQIKMIDEIISEFKSVKLVSVRSLKEIKETIKKYPKIKFVEKEKGLSEVSKCKCDVVINALVGFVGLKPTLDAIKSSHDVLLANKESLVVAGEIIIINISNK